MFLNKILNSKQITRKQLSELSNIPYSTINDICDGKIDFNKCDVETVYKIAKSLNVSMELLVENSIIENQKILSYEYGLPSYLQKDLDAYKKGLEENSSLLDCLWGELYGSINGAEIDDRAISLEHADYLRKKFLFDDGNE